MFKKILVCLDGSPLAEQILPYAVEQAQKFESKIILFTVFSEPTFTSVALPGFPGVPMDTRAMEIQAQQEEKESTTYLQSVADKLASEKGLQAEGVTTMGVAGQTIVQYAAANEIELIAIATHGRGGLGRAVTGSVADYVIRNSTIPILLIKPEKAKKVSPKKN
jgi:nucleotide-binding universal stress UspA family protein